MSTYSGSGGSSHNYNDGRLYAYVLVLEGASRGHLVKVTICFGAREASEIIFFEALNGFSTVFSAVISAQAAHWILERASRGQSEALRGLRFQRVIVPDGHKRSWDFMQGRTHTDELLLATRLDSLGGPVVGFIN